MPSAIGQAGAGQIRASEERGTIMIENTNGLQGLGEASQTPTDLDSILSDGGSESAANVSANSQSAAPSQSRDQSDANGHGNDVAPWTYAAMKRERSQRQAFQRRVRELEEENRALHSIQAGEAPGEGAPRDGGSSFWIDPEERIAQLERNANLRASKAEIVSEYGKAALDSLDQVLAQAWNARHPDIPLLAEQMRASPDPVRVAMKWAQNVAGWSPEGEQSISTRNGAAVFPSSFATARNAGRRSGPGWGGPTPLADIFDRTAPKRA